MRSACFSLWLHDAYMPIYIYKQGRRDGDPSDHPGPAAAAASRPPIRRLVLSLLQQASACGRPVMAATSAQAAAVLCLVVVLAASPRAAVGNCRNDCNAACTGWPVVCQLSCASACMGEAGQCLPANFSTSSIQIVFKKKHTNSI